MRSSPRLPFPAIPDLPPPATSRLESAARVSVAEGISNPPVHAVGPAPTPLPESRCPKHGTLTGMPRSVTPCTNRNNRRPTTAADGLPRLQSLSFSIIFGGLWFIFTLTSAI